MPAPQPIPANAVSNLATCATAYLYSIGGLHYYATEDCDTGATGTGVSGRRFTPSGCNAGVCNPDSVVTSLKAGSPSTKASSLPANNPHPFRNTFSKELLRKLRLDLKFLYDRPVPGAGKNDGISTLRRNMAAYLVGATGSAGELENIDELPDAKREPFFEKVYLELIKARIDDTDSTSTGFVTLDQDLGLETMPFGALTAGATTNPTKVGYEVSTNVSVSDALFKTAGALAPLTPFVKLKTRRVTQGPAAVKDVYFRIQRVERAPTATVPGFTHYVGQQIGEAHLNWDNLGSVPKNEIADAKWIDRHGHFHVIEATPNGVTTQQILVYSSLNVSAREQFT